MPQVASQCNYLALFFCLLLQFFGTLLGCSTTTKMQPGQMAPKTEEHQPRRPRVQRQTTSYDKVELLHRMLVQQQLQHLEQRRLLRLALARRRLEFELSN